MMCTSYHHCEKIQTLKLAVFNCGQSEVIKCSVLDHFEWVFPILKKSSYIDGKQIFNLIEHAENISSVHLLHFWSILWIIFLSSRNNTSTNLQGIL